MEGLRPLCPVRAVAAYLDRSKSFRGSTRQLLICYGGSSRGQGLSKAGLSRWLREVISPAHNPASQGRVTAHSTRGVSTPVSMLHGVSVGKICESARWSSSCLFAEYCLHGVGSGSFSPAVLERCRGRFSLSLVRDYARACAERHCVLPALLALD